MQKHVINWNKKVAEWKRLINIRLLVFLEIWIKYCKGIQTLSGKSRESCLVRDFLAFSCKLVVIIFVSFVFTWAENFPGSVGELFLGETGNFFQFGMWQPLHSCVYPLNMVFEMLVMCVCVCD